jgi:hypothetical protein
MPNVLGFSADNQGDTLSSRSMRSGSVNPQRIAALFVGGIFERVEGGIRFFAYSTA